MITIKTIAPQADVLDAEKTDWHFLAFCEKSLASYRDKITTKATWKPRNKAALDAKITEEIACRVGDMWDFDTSHCGIDFTVDEVEAYLFEHTHRTERQAERDAEGHHAALSFFMDMTEEEQNCITEHFDQD